MDAELQRLRRELDRFVALIANGNAPQRVLEEIAARERRAKELETVLVRLKVAQSTKLDVSSIRALALARATDLRYGIQDLVVPLELAQRWGLPHGVRGNLNERLQPWERLKDLCGQLVDLPLQHQFALYAAAVLLSCAPSATATKEERLNAHPFIRLPYFAGLAYLIAKARVEGRKEIDVPEWDHGVLPVAAGNLCEKQPSDVRKAVDERAQMWEDFTRVSEIQFHLSILDLELNEPPEP